MSRSHFATFRVYLHHLHLPWNRYQKENFLRLGAAFLKRRSLPLRRLARTLAGVGKLHAAADKRLRRFLGNPHLDQAACDAALAAHLQFLLPRLGAVPFVPVMLDWTFITGRAILWAQIPYRGRALPLLSLVQEFPMDVDDARRTEAEKQLLTRLRACWPDTAPPPLLLMDRGFDKGPLLSWLIALGYRFIVRVTRGHYLYDAAGSLLNTLRDPDGNVVHQGCLQPEVGKLLLFPNVTYLQKERLPVHLGLTAIWDPKTLNVKSWRLVTNLAEEQLPRLGKLYGLRMMPEEVHRDAKSGYAASGFGLGHLGRMRIDRLERYLLLFSMIYGFLVLVAESERESRQWLQERHWGLSLVQFALDHLAAAGSAAVKIARQACASTQLIPLWPSGVHS